MSKTININYENAIPDTSIVIVNAEDSYNDASIFVTVDSRWDNMALFILFEAVNGQRYKVVYNSTNGTLIPTEIMGISGVHKFSLYGVDSTDNTHTLNSAPTLLQVIKAVKPTDTQTDPTPSEIQQFESEFASVLATASSSATLSESYAVGGTSSRTGEDTDNSKYYSVQSQAVLTEMERKAASGELNGKNFTILGYYDTLALLEAAHPNPEAGDAYGIGTTSPYNIYVWDGTNLEWVNNGTSKGDTGDTPNITIGTVASSETATATITGTTPDLVLNLGLPKGESGKGIVSITKTSGTGESGTTDIYTITYTDSTTSTFSVYNGANGEDGVSVTIQIGTITTVSTGNPATATLRGTYPNYILNLGLPQGTQGEQGYYINNVYLKSGSHQAGTTDVYGMKINNTDTTEIGTFSVYNGTDGTGSGDMSKSIYDQNNNGIVDNSEELDGHTGSYYTTAENILIADSASHFTATNVEGALTELFTSVSDGKSEVATAITDKGVTTASDATFTQMATNISSIETGIDTSDATAVASNILLSKTAYAQGNKITGTMPDNGAVATVLDTTTTSYAVPYGYHSGTGTVSISPQSKAITPSVSSQTISPDSGKILSSVTVAGDSDLTSSNIKSGVEIFGVTGNYSGIDTSDATAVATNILSGKTAYASGTKLTGTMTNNGNIVSLLNTNQTSYTIPSGYHGGNGYAYINLQSKSATPAASSQTISPDSGYVLSSVTVSGDSDLVSSNIKSGVEIFGVTGSYSSEPLSMIVSGITPSYNSSTLTNYWLIPSGYSTLNYTFPRVVCIGSYLYGGVTSFDYYYYSFWNSAVFTDIVTDTGTQLSRYGMIKTQLPSGGQIGGIGINDFTFEYSGNYLLIEAQGNDYSNFTCTVYIST